MKVRPVDTNRSGSCRRAGRAPRRGACGLVIDSVFCVATTEPVTSATNIRHLPSGGADHGSDGRHDQFFVRGDHERRLPSRGRRCPLCSAAGLALVAGEGVGGRIEPDAEILEPGTDFRSGPAARFSPIPPANASHRGRRVRRFQPRASGGSNRHRRRSPSGPGRLPRRPSSRSAHVAGRAGHAGQPRLAGEFDEEILEAPPRSPWRHGAGRRDRESPARLFCGRPDWGSTHRGRRRSSRRGSNTALLEPPRWQETARSGRFASSSMSRPAT
jgi:hypothetical protein